MDTINEAALLEVYSLLKERFNLTLTKTSSLDDDFTIDCPIIVARAHGRILWLYEYGGDFVLDVMDEAMTKGTHWHPFNVAAAIKDIISFLEGKEEYKLERFRR